MSELTKSQQEALDKLRAAKPSAAAIPAVVGPKLVRMGLAVAAPGEAKTGRGFGSYKAA